MTDEILKDKLLIMNNRTIYIFNYKGVAPTNPPMQHGYWVYYPKSTEWTQLTLDQISVLFCNTDLQNYTLVHVSKKRTIK